MFEKINKIDKSLTGFTKKKRDRAQINKIRNYRGEITTDNNNKTIREYCEQLFANNDPDNHLEPDILECEVKWALGSITMNKTSGGDAIPVELFQILKDDAVKVLHSICHNMENSAEATELEKVSFHPNPKERQCQRMLKLPHNCTHLTSLAPSQASEICEP